MINACELCVKIAIENEKRERVHQMERIINTKNFAEEVISPILEELIEMPEELFIGYLTSYGGFYREWSKWVHGVTHRGYSKQFRNLENRIGGSYSLLDYDFLNQYLKDFGFKVTYCTKEFETVQYSSYVRNETQKVDCIYLSVICPIEEILN